jgi:hypothetical protein
MARRGNSSQSFLRSKELLSFSEISYDREGNNVLKYGILKEALACNSEGTLIRNKANIAKILNRYGVLYRMIFNAMNMDQYSYDEVQEALDYLSEYINDLGISGIIEFHAADKTQNSDHIHFWINSEDTLIYNKIAGEMVAMGYSNKEDVYIQKYEDNKKLDEIEYVNDKDSRLSDRFSIEDKSLIVEEKANNSFVSSLHERYYYTVDNISNLFKETLLERESNIEKNENLNSFKQSSIVKNCTLPKTEKTNAILSRIEELNDSYYLN